MNILSKKSLIYFFTISILVTATGSALATKMLHRNAEELATLAERIFVGVCISVEENRDGNMLYTEYTFEVLQNIKGVNSGTLVFRQFGRAKGVGSVIGMPAYDRGKKYMLFLRHDSEYGLTSPIGLGQGAFQIVKREDGVEQASNTFGNSGLFHRMDAKSPQYAPLNAREKSLMTTTRGTVDFNSFVGLLQKLAR